MYFRDDWQVFDDASQAAATELLLYFRSLRERDRHGNIFAGVVAGTLLRLV